jgi:glycosyltransferase involved in cell wall biosynthesis|tara:strand:+ start:2634 stop:3704 length:1071 start_codon:yes stop_codon:yes gene_type:complete
MKFVQVISDMYGVPRSGADLRNESIRVALSQFGEVWQVSPEMLLMPQPSGNLQDGLNLPPDLIVVEGVQLIESAQQMLALFPSTRLIFDFHNVESDLLRQQDIAKLPSVLRLIAPIVFHNRWRRARALDLLALRLAETVWVCSVEDRERICKLCDSPPRIVIVPNLAPDLCVTANRQTLAHSGSGPVLLFVGHLGYAPNKRAVRHLVRKVMPRVLYHYRHARLIVAGRQPNARLKRMLEKTCCIQLIANPKEIAPIYDQADIVVVPLAEGGGSRIKILEALALGCPIVATAKAVEGLGLVPDRHFLQAENAADMAKAVARLFKDEILVKLLIEEGHAHLEENFTQELVRREIYASL